MKTWGMMLALVVACVAGCAPRYRVQVNTFSDPNRPVTQGASVHVLSDPNSGNPILRNQIASKLDELLRTRGYTPVETADRAKYLLTFEAGFSSTQVADFVPMYRPYSGFYGGFGGRFGPGGFGYTTYVPYVNTVYVHWLRMRLYTKEGASLNQADVIWLAEAVTGADSPELRQAVNYLLVACMEHFGVDTGRWVATTIKRTDPRILALTGATGR